MLFITCVLERETRDRNQSQKQETGTRVRNQRQEPESGTRVIPRGEENRERNEGKK